MICRLAYGNVDSTRVTGSVYKQNNGLKERSPVAILLGVTYRGKRLPSGQPFLFCTDGLHRVFDVGPVCSRLFTGDRTRFAGLG